MEQQPIIKPIIDDLKNVQKPKPAPAAVPKGHPQPAEQDQDSGGGYNPDHTDPQT